MIWTFRVLLLISFFAFSFCFDAYSTGRQEKEASDLPELTVESDRNRILHVLAFMRDYSTLSTYTDTVFLFREKLVDYMLVPNKKVKFKEWRRPRTILSRSYYRFTNSNGLDSVSDESPLHFSWTDWMEMPPLEKLPEKLSFHKSGTDTVKGKYGSSLILNKDNDRVEADIDVLAAMEGRRWCPSFAGFFNEGLEFDRFSINLRYDNVLGEYLSAADLTGYQYYIESRGRGHEMHRIPLNIGPIFITSLGEVYILDRELLTKREAINWTNRMKDDDMVSIFEPADAPPLDPSILALIDRVEHLDKEGVRLLMPPDQRLVSLNYGKRKKNVAERAFYMLKQLTGVTLIKSRKNINDKWKDFKKKQMERKEFKRH